MTTRTPTPLEAMFIGLKCMIGKCQRPPVALITTMCEKGHLRNGPMCNIHRREERMLCIVCQKNGDTSALFGPLLPPDPEYVVTGSPIGKRSENKYRPETVHTLRCSREPRDGALDTWTRWEVPGSEIEFRNATGKPYTGSAIWHDGGVDRRLDLCGRCNPTPSASSLKAYPEQESSDVLEPV